ncbi:hypothetical protein [Streptomyces sp. NPDC098781]|uniref:hypothetical protein n=1 Tax=Streptomyces sp. NPDC098781 TaxID=3366097 RepID=UPI00382C21E9
MASDEPPSPSAPRATRIRRTLWICGLIASLALAIVPPLVGSSTALQLGIVISLAGVSIALLVEQSTKTEQMSSEVRQELATQAAEISAAVRGVTPVIESPPPCKQFVLDYVRSYQAIEQHSDVAVFADIRRSKGEELLDCMRDLSNGAVTVSIDGPYSVRARSFDDVSLYRAVSMGPFEFWRGSFGQRYLDMQRSAIERFDLTVERIFVFPHAEDPILEEVVRSQVAAGIDTWVVLRSWVPEHHQEHVVDQGVLKFRNGSKLLMQPLATQYRQRADRERLSVISSEIRAAEFSLDIVRSNAVKMTETSPWPPN